MPRPLLLGAIADDVTGATDLCSMLARGGMRVVQTSGVVDIELPEVDAVVVGLKTRTAPVDAAVSQSLAALEWLLGLGAAQVFFKICSTFDSTPKGNIGRVADALLDALGADGAVVCPVYPANGRTMYQGHLFVNGRLLSESPLAEHPLTPMTDPDIVRFLGLQTERRVGLVPYDLVRRGADAIGARVDELRGEGVAYVVADALADDDLRELGAACARDRLLVGGAGLALGLPANHGLEPGAHGFTPEPGPTVVLAGSTSAATREQVARMADRFPALKIGLDTDLDAVPSRVDDALIAYTTASPEEVAATQAAVGAAEASLRLESALGHLARRFVDSGVRRLVVAGGETSGAVLDALDVRALEVGAEIAPGVPWMRTLDDRGLVLALKSGNFGGPDFFLDAVEGA